MRKKIAAVFGGSGLVGSSIVELLKQNPYFEEVHLYLREPLQSSLPQKFKTFVVDFQDLPSTLQYMEASHVFCCLGATLKSAGSKEKFYDVDFHFVRKIARISQMKGVECFSAISSLGAHLRSVSFYLRTKAEMERELLSIPFISLHIYRPSLLVGKRKEFRRGEKAYEKLLRFLKPVLKGRLKIFLPTSAKVLAEEMIFQATQGNPGARIFENEAIGSFLENHP